MLHAADDEMRRLFSLRLEEDAGERRVVGLGAAGGENDLGRFAVEQRRNLTSSVFDRVASALAGPMQASMDCRTPLPRTGAWPTPLPARAASSRCSRNTRAPSTKPQSELKAGADGNRTHRTSVYDVPPVLKTGAVTRAAFTPEDDYCSSRLATVRS